MKTCPSSASSRPTSLRRAPPHAARRSRRSRPYSITSSPPSNPTTTRRRAASRPPNPERETIFLRDVLESRPFRESQSKLTIALGKTIDGINYVADLTRMPHLLIAGATGTGKSVCLNTLVVSVLYKARPDEVKFILIDPKRLELGLYADIPHLATPIITEPKKAANALKWAVTQMEQRYKQLAQWGVRNIDGY